MTDNPNHLDGLLDQLAEEGRRQPDPAEHPSSGTLSAYHARELSPEETLLVQEHLAVCRRCQDLLLEFASFLETPLDERPEGVTDLAAAMEWRELRERMAREAGGRPYGSGRQGILLSPMAASLFLVLFVGPLVGVLWWDLALRSRVAELRAPQVEVEPVRLEETRGETFRASMGDKLLDVELVSSAPAKFPEYRIEITSEAGRVLWSKVVAKKRSGNLRLILMPKFLGPGLYYVRLSGVQGGQDELLSTYTLRIEP